MCVCVCVRVCISLLFAALGCAARCVCFQILKANVSGAAAQPQFKPRSRAEDQNQDEDEDEDERERASKKRTRERSNDRVNERAYLTHIIMYFFKTQKKATNRLAELERGLERRQRVVGFQLVNKSRQRQNYAARAAKQLSTRPIIRAVRVILFTNKCQALSCSLARPLSLSNVARSLCIYT